MNKTDIISDLLSCLVLIMLCLMVITEPVYAVPPVPARIGGEVTVNGTLLDQADSANYTFTVTRQNGTEYLPPAADLNGLNDFNWYVMDIPLFDAGDRPEGAPPGEAAVVHVFQDTVEMVVTSPQGGVITVGESGSTTRVDLFVGDGTIITDDRDGDGVPDSQDLCPDDPNKSAPGICGCGTQDTDSDGDDAADCIDNCDNDPNKTGPGICGCGEPDEDSDNNQVPDCNDSFPHDPASDPSLNPPARPVLLSPADNQPGVGLTPELTVHAQFVDPDPGDAHGHTQWQIGTGPDFSNLVLDIFSDTHLTSLTIPHLVLSGDMTYYWRVKFYDSSGNDSQWSETFWYTTLSGNFDLSPANGVPDYQEAGQELDMDNNGTPDIYQSNIKCVRTTPENACICIKASNNVTAIEALMAIDPEEIADLVNAPKNLWLGVISFRARVQNPDDTASVIVYLPFAAPDDSEWYKYNLVDGWQNYTEFTTFSTDRTSFSLQFKDGGMGDADGTRNQVVVDPSGLVLKNGGNTRLISENSQDGGGGGCFISRAGEKPYKSIKNF